MLSNRVADAAIMCRGVAATVMGYAGSKTAAEGADILSSLVAAAKTVTSWSCSICGLSTAIFRLKSRYLLFACNKFFSRSSTAAISCGHVASSNATYS